MEVFYKETLKKKSKKIYKTDCLEKYFLNVEFIKLW